MVLLTEVHIVVIFPQFYPISFFCSRIPSRIPHDIQWSCLRFFLAMTVSQHFLVFNDVASFEEYWSGMFQNIPRLFFSDVSLGLQVLGKRPHSLNVTGSSIIGYLFIPIWHSLVVANKYNVNICKELDLNSDAS